MGATGLHTTLNSLPLGTARLMTPSRPLRRAAQRPQNHTPLRLLTTLTHHAGTIILVRTPTAHLKPSVLSSRNDL